MRPDRHNFNEWLGIKGNDDKTTKGVHLKIKSWTEFIGKKKRFALKKYILFLKSNNGNIWFKGGQPACSIMYSMLEILLPLIRIIFYSSTYSFQALKYTAWSKWQIAPCRTCLNIICFGHHLKDPEQQRYRTASYLNLICLLWLTFFYGNSLPEKMVFLQ